MADILHIGISGLRVHQTALSVTGHNITNANTEGYSRQEVEIYASSPQFLGGVWLGNGAELTDVSRIVDEFYIRQLRLDTSSFNELDILASNAEQIDSLLADPSSGLQPGLESFFGSLQASIDDPSSIPARQVVLSESQGLVDRFHTIDARLTEINTTLNGQMEAVAGKINALAQAIADLNEQIQFASAGGNGNLPNDLLDRRDLLLKDLSELVGTTVVTQDGNSINVSIGNGQSLVTGLDVQTISVVSGKDDPQRSSIVIGLTSGTHDITDDIQGGQLAGILRYRQEILDPTISQFGRTAIALQENINSQHQLGIDITGLPGDLFFEDYNDPSIASLRVVGNSENAQPNDRDMKVYIADANQLTTSDYRLDFVGPNDVTFKVTRVSDGQEVLTSALSTDFPDEFEIDGFTLSIDAGSFKAGDQYYIMPTRRGAKDIELNLEIPQQLALATPIMTDTNVGNIGTADISPGYITDLSAEAFAIPGTLQPPLLFKFTGESAYDVLDNTDPANPVPLFPPLMNQIYVPGMTNELLPTDSTKSVVTSLGGYVPSSPAFQDWRVAPTTPGNGLFPGRITLTEPDPITGYPVERSQIFIEANTSAEDIATRLSQETGISASARTVVELTDFTTGPPPTDSPFPDEPVYLSLNGVELTDVLPPEQVKYEEGYPDEVPEPLTPNFIADRINANYDFQAEGIIARSDGVSVEIISITGKDLAFEINGETGDGFKYSNADDIYLKPTGQALTTPLSKYDGYDFTQDGPYTFDFEIPGQQTYTIELNEEYETGAELLDAIKSQIETTTVYYYNGEIDVDIDEKGNILFQPRLQVNGAGDFGSYKVTMGGQVKVVLDEGLEFSADPNLSNLFEQEPEHEPYTLGYEIQMTGFPQEGDEFYVDFNEDAVTDDRNGNLIAAIQNKEVIEEDMTISESYAKLVEDVGSVTARAQISRETSEVLLQDSVANVESVSGVNLDEEAGKLIQYELGYNASAQIIQVAQQLFDTLIQTFR